MILLSLFALALALAMDAFAVAVATGIRLGVVTGRQVFRPAFHFGLFQFLMPLAGWFLGLTVRGFIERWDHWVAFALLAFIGVNMLREAASRRDGAEEEQRHAPWPIPPIPPGAFRCLCCPWLPASTPWP